MLRNDKISNDVKSCMSLATSYKILNSVDVLQDVVMDLHLHNCCVWSIGYIVGSVHGRVGCKGSKTSNSTCLVSIFLLG